MSPDQQRRHGDGRAGSTQRGNGNAGVESPDQFLQHEDRSRDRRVEGDRQASAGAGGDEGKPVDLLQPENPAPEAGQVGTDLHTGSLAAERQAATNGEQATDEFYREQKHGSGRQLPFQYQLDMGNTAAGSWLSGTPDQPGSNGSSHSH